MDRKQFIKSIGVIVVGGISAATLFEGCAVRYLNYKMEANKVVVKKAGLQKSHFALVNVVGFPAPIYLRHSDKGEYIALLTRCTHKGCEVNVYYDRLSCPCHGSEFSYKGEVISPPAKDPLMKFNVTSDQDNIYIHIIEN